VAGWGDIPQAQVHKFIDPLFGFVTRRTEKPGKTGESRPRRDYTTRPYFFDCGTPQEKQIAIGGRQAVCKYSSDGELAVICKGRRGAGFWVCLQCGAASNEPPSNRRRERSHDTPMGAKCSQTIKGPYYLGHTFRTDVLFLSLPGAAGDESFWFSLLYAVLEGASAALAIRRRDLDGCLHVSGSDVGLVLFDSVPGGAGHVKRIVEGDNLLQVLTKAFERVSQCTCGPETSCQSCLRNYENQFCHDKLKRGAVVEFLAPLVRE